MTTTYRDELLLALRMRDVPAPRIAEALAEVDSHVAESGESPLDAFGPPAEYADQIVLALGPDGTTTWTTTDTLRSVGVGLGAAAAAWLLCDGVIAAASGSDAVAGLPAWVAVVVGGLALVVGAALLIRWTRRAADRVLDPRTGEDMTPPLPRWALVLLVGLPFILVAAAVAIALVLLD